MVKFLKTDGNDLEPLRREYLGSLPGPRDGMWENFVDLANSYIIEIGGGCDGYCSINSQGKMLQFFMPNGTDKQNAFSLALDRLEVTGANVATCETDYLSLCMDHQKRVNVNGFMYRWDKKTGNQPLGEPEQHDPNLIRTVLKEGHDEAVSFGLQALGVDEGWLSSYFKERIDLGELFGYWMDGQLVATGELRVSNLQPPFVDLGMVVSKQHRGKGLATFMLRQLALKAVAQEQIPICSTEKENIAAQKAIVRSGFACHYRILEIEF